MIHIFPASFVTPTNKAGYVRLTFEVDDVNRDGLSKLLNSPMGTQFLMVAYEIESQAEEIQQSYSDPDYSRKQLLKRVHAMIGDFSAKSRVDSEKIKQLLKLKLKSRGVDIESLKDLNETGLAQVVYILNTQLNPSVFNYLPYVQSTGDELKQVSSEENT